jgi:hypothetical protein
MAISSVRVYKQTKKKREINFNGDWDGRLADEAKIVCEFHFWVPIMTQYCDFHSGESGFCVKIKEGIF